MIETQDQWRESLLGEFLDESGQLLDRLNENLLAIDAQVRAAAGTCCDEAQLNEMFRAAHSLKGLSAMMGFDDINRLTHNVENVFDAARKNTLPITGDVVDLMFQAVDRLLGMVDGLKEPAAAAVDCTGVLTGIERLLDSAGVVRKAGSQAEAERALAAAMQTTPPAAATPAPAFAPSSATADPFEGIVDDAALSDKYLSLFLDDAAVGLDRLAELLLSEDRGRDLKSLLHAVHKLKGSAASVGLKRAAKLAHLMEDQVQRTLEAGGELSPSCAEAMLRATDGLRQYVDNLRRGSTEFGDCAELARALGEQSAVSDQQSASSKQQAAISGQHSAVSKQQGASDQVPESLRIRVAAVVPEGSTAVAGVVWFEPGLPMVGLKAQLVHEKLANLGELVHFDPPAGTLDDLDAIESVAFGAVTDKTCEEIRDRLAIAGVARVAIVSIERGTGAAEDEPPRTIEGGRATQDAQAPQGERAAKSERAVPDGRPAESGRAESGRAPAETLRVETERLDELMNLAGQLVISKARFAQIGDRLKNLRATKRWAQSLARIASGLGELGEDDTGRGDREARTQVRRLCDELQRLTGEMQALEKINESIGDLSEAVHQLDRVSDGIQQAVMDTRMIPVGPLFNRFKRVIRDITRVNGKSVRLAINGEKTKLDKRMIDELGDPLIHIVRNAADHGIEPPEVREAAGKPREGTISLDAFHRGNHVVIQIRDDGAGLSTERILKKCLERGLLTEADAQRMTPAQIHQMIWAPGLSTAEKVTEVSGRGMGMDIVKSKIELLHGTVELESEPGQGTLLSLKLPLTLAILPSLLVDIAGDVFALPMESVIEIVRVGREQISTVHGRRTIWVRGRAISLVGLDDVLAWADGRRQPPPSGDLTVVIVGEARGDLGLAVDSVLGEQDVVIKSIAENFRSVPGITGASILGDGRVSLILDVAALISLAAARAAAAVTETQP